MAENLAEVDRIANDPAAPTFENTIAALERTGRTLDRVSTIYGICVSTMSDAAVPGGRARDGAEARRVRRRDHPEREALQRIEAVYDSRETLGLTPEQQRLAWLYYTNFVRAGAKLDAGRQEAAVGDQPAARLALHELQPERARRRGRPRCCVLENEADLAGLPESARAAAAAAAEARGQKGKWAITNTRSSIEPFLTYSDRRDLREKVVAHVRQPRRQRRHDTTTTRSSPRSSQLRAERAKLLGYATHAHWRLENTMAQDARARDGADGSGVDAGGRARARGSRRHAGDRRPGEGAKHHASSPGTTATTRRRSARRSTTSTRTRSSRTCSSRSCAKACSGSPASSSASASRR